MLSVPPTQPLSLRAATGDTTPHHEVWGGCFHSQKDLTPRCVSFSVDQIPLSHIAWSLATAQFSTDPHMGLLRVPVSAAHHLLETPFLHRRSHQLVARENFRELLSGHCPREDRIGSPSGSFS